MLSFVTHTEMEFTASGYCGATATTLRSVRRLNNFPKKPKRNTSFLSSHRRRRRQFDLRPRVHAVRPQMPPADSQKQISLIHLIKIDLMRPNRFRQRWLSIQTRVTKIRL